MTKRYPRTRARASTVLALICIPFHDPFTLAASPVREACQYYDVDIISFQLLHHIVQHYVSYYHRSDYIIFHSMQYNKYVLYIAHI